MIKDMEEAIYYCTITKAMEEKEKETNSHATHYFTEYYYPDPYYRDMDRGTGRMYYNDNGSNSGNSNGGSRGNSNGGSSNGMGSRGYSDGAMYYPGGTRYYSEFEYPMDMMRDAREGRSGKTRRTYMENKEMHTDKAAQLKELEKYVQELSKDLVEMVEGASPEEKQLLQ